MNLQPPTKLKTIAWPKRNKTDESLWGSPTSVIWGYGQRAKLNSASKFESPTLSLVLSTNSARQLRNASGPSSTKQQSSKPGPEREYCIVNRRIRIFG